MESTLTGLARGLAMGALVAAACVPVAIGAPASAASPGVAPHLAQDACLLSPSGRLSEHNETTSCLRVTASLSRAPAVGERATLEFTVDAAVALRQVRISAELPPHLRWVTPPVGMAQTSRTSRAPHVKGLVRQAGRTVDMTAGQRLRHRGVVEAVAAGPAEITVAAVAEAAGSAGHGLDAVHLTIGARAGGSRMGIAVNRRATTTPAAGTAQPLVRPNLTRQVPSRAAQPASQRAAAVGPSAAGGRACATGSWNYTDHLGVERPAISWTVEAWDEDSSGGDDLLASSLTGFQGEYTLCFDNNDPGSKGQDVYMRFHTSNGVWRVQAPDDFVYNYTTPTQGDVRDGTTADFGWLQPGDPTQMRAAAAFAATQVTWNGIPGACWDEIGECRPVVVIWTPDSTEGTYYSLKYNKVRLKAADPDEPMVVSHEVSHAIMDDVFDDDYPSFPNCSPHRIHKASSAGCAWTEGFAEWVPMMVFNTASFNGTNLEKPTWGRAKWDEGDTVEGRVAGALWDLSDTNNEGTDRIEEGIANIWHTFQRHNSTTFAEFWKHRKQDGFSVGNNTRGSLFQSTIDYGFVE